MRLQLSISPKFARQFIALLVLVAVGLAMLSLAFEFVNSLLLDSASQSGGDGGKMQLFALGADGNVPQWYSASLLLLCSILLALITAAAAENNHRTRWMGLSIIFLYLSVDEAASIHEKVSSVLEARFSPEGILSYAWVIPYGLLTLVFVLAYLKFVRDLPSATRWLFIIAGAFYVGGALGLEMVNAGTDDLFGRDNLIYILGTHLEEVFEMLGVSVFLYALLLYISSNVREINVSFSGRKGLKKGAPR